MEGKTEEAVELLGRRVYGGEDGAAMHAQKMHTNPALDTVADLFLVRKQYVGRILESPLPDIWSLYH